MSVELDELSVPLLRLMLQSSGESNEVRLREPLGTLTFEAMPEEPPIDLSRSPRLRQILDEARDDYRRHGGVTLAEVKARRAAEETAQAERCGESL